MSNQAPTPSLADLEARLEMAMRTTLKAAQDVIEAGGTVEEVASASKVKQGIRTEGTVSVTMAAIEQER